jgi:hypothetical protein
MPIPFFHAVATRLAYIDVSSGRRYCQEDFCKIINRKPTKLFLRVHESSFLILKMTLFKSVIPFLFMM